MALTDLTYNEVRIRQGSKFQQTPNFVTAHEALDDGMFVYINSDGEYAKASSTNPASHFVVRSGEHRNLPDEIVDHLGHVQVGEPVMAMTGQGVVTVPVLGNVDAGDQLVVSGGWATAYTAGANYIIGQATKAGTVAVGDTYVWVDVLLSLPATYKPA